nr:hypothetical protein [Paracoccus sp. (in: a-proteobacteria)]
NDAAIAAQMWQQEPERRAELAGVIEAHLFLAFGPLSDGELALLTSELARPGQRRLAGIVARGIEAARVDLSRALGRALARQQREMGR